MAPAIRRAGWGADSACGAARVEASATVSSSGSSSSRISAQIRVRSARAACTLRWQNASCMPGSICSAMATPWRAGSSPMMWRTTTSLPKLPVRRTASLPTPSDGCISPASVARTTASASRGWSSDTFRSRSSTSSAGSPSSCSATLPSASVTVCTGATGRQPCVTRDTSATPSPNATPDKPPLNTPLAAPWPLMLPLPPTANCTVWLRPDDRPPNR